MPARSARPTPGWSRALTDSAISHALARIDDDVRRSCPISGEWLRAPFWDLSFRGELAAVIIRDFAFDVVVCRNSQRVGIRQNGGATEVVNSELAAFVACTKLWHDEVSLAGDDDLSRMRAGRILRQALRGADPLVLTDRESLWAVSVHDFSCNLI